MGDSGRSNSRYLLIVLIQKWSRTEVRSITILLSTQYTTGRAYIFGGFLCSDAQCNNQTVTTSVEMLDMSLGKWQAFPVPLGAFYISYFPSRHARL